MAPSVSAVPAQPAVRPVSTPGHGSGGGPSPCETAQSESPCSSPGTSVYRGKPNDELGAALVYSNQRLVPLHQYRNETLFNVSTVL